MTARTLLLTCCCSCLITSPSANALSMTAEASPKRITQQQQHKILSTVKNFRPISSSSLIYRSANLDNLSVEDAERLLSGDAFYGNDGSSSSGGGGGSRNPRPLAAVIDLRNSDEIQKGQKVRTEGAKYFYSQLLQNDGDIDIDATSNTGGPRLIHIPILRDVDAFWDEAIGRMEPSERIAATLATAFRGGAFDRAAARNLERGGPASLYTVMMATAARPIGMALEACVEESSQKGDGGGGGPVIFHCQKGKDRTGVVAMLLQSCMGQGDDEIVEAYRLSGELLGGEDATAASGGSDSDKSAGGMIDWSHFRGSPPSAMIDTLQWVRDRYGSIYAYLDAASFDEEQRMALRKAV
mmetsp:Transcript_14168/g.28569  ORF Transcript_14168/g.28569 Transcript_14168/m.28569 type:complete len:354 (+) Transcript_14168:464-1525(+)